MQQQLALPRRTWMPSCNISSEAAGTTLVSKNLPVDQCGSDLVGYELHSEAAAVERSCQRRIFHLSRSCRLRCPEDTEVVESMDSYVQYVPVPRTVHYNM